MADVPGTTGTEVATVQRGDRVVVAMPGGEELGTVQYVRMAPPEYREPEAVSVRLDSQVHRRDYGGTVVAADWLRGSVPEHNCCDAPDIEWSGGSDWISQSSGD